MKRVNRPAVTDLQDRRGRLASRAKAARRGLDRTPSSRRDRRYDRTGGRVWVNGAELGGTDPRHSPLALSYD